MKLQAATGKFKCTWKMAVKVVCKVLYRAT